LGVSLPGSDVPAVNTAKGKKGKGGGGRRGPTSSKGEVSCYFIFDYGSGKRKKRRGEG